MRGGLLALQGAFAAHGTVLEALGHEARLVRTARDVEGLDGLVLPGGESTVMLRLMDAPLATALDAWVARGGPVLATCAGLILAARGVDPAQRSFGWLDVDVRRNGWGRQRDSAEARADDGRCLMLIRAPRITRVGDARIEATLEGEPVLVRSGRVWGATFHPELTDDALHRQVFG